MKKVVWKSLRLAFLGVGLFLFAGIIQKIGWANIKGQLIHLGWTLTPILSISFLWYFCYAGAWKQIIKHQENDIPFWKLFRAKIAGETINTIQPTNFLGGDPMRIYLLRRASNVTCVTASVVVDRTINSVAIVSVIFLGAIVTFSLISGLPKEVIWGASLFLTVCTAMIIYFFLHQKRGLFSAILKLAKKIHLFPKLVVKHFPHAEELDFKVAKLYQKSHSIFWEALGFHIVGRLLGVFEVYLIGQMITPKFTFLIALVLATLAPIINMTFTFIPGALGVLEGAYSGALYLLGFDPTIGITIQLVKRIRSLLWIGLGFVFISLGRSPRSPQTFDYNKDPLQQPL